MARLEDLLRPGMASLKPYQSARDEHPEGGMTFLDANENPHGTLNRYPDPRQKALRQALAEHYALDAEQILVGNGSDEIIDLLLRLFCEPGRDSALTVGPTYGMYQVAAASHGVSCQEVPLGPHFDLQEEQVQRILNTPRAKLLFLCSPNNPTGNIFSSYWIRYLLKEFSGIVVLDEAYADFSRQPSWRGATETYPRLVVMNTLSKAWGLAAARVGWAVGQMWIIRHLQTIKPPYNVSGLNQAAALEKLAQKELFRQEVAEILRERERLEKALPELPLVERVFPSEANFLLLRVKEAPAMYQSLKEEDLLVRLRHSAIPHTLRISVGTPAENDRLLSLWPKAAERLESPSNSNK